MAEQEKDELLTLNEFITKTQYLVNPKRALTNSLLGIELEQKALLPTAMEKPGIMFMTRPMLDLSVSNLMRDRKMANLITDFDRPSIAAFIRGTLDPITMYKSHKKLTDNLLVDPQMPFIPIMTNALKTLSGWEDLVAPTKVVGGGVMKEEYVYIDGIIDHYRKITLDLTFENVHTDPIMGLIDTWTRYATLKYAGVMKKHMPLVLQDRVSYHTRIYRFALSNDMRYVTSYGCTGYTFPVVVPSGKKLDYKSDEMYNDTNRDLTIRFEGVGFYYNDPVVFRMFNMAVSSTHSGMRAVNNGDTGHEMVIVPRSLISRMSGMCYPRVNPLTKELEWWTDKEKLDKVNED